MLKIIKKVKNAGTGKEEFGTPDTPQIGMPGGHPEEEEDTEMEIDGLDTGMGDEELDLYAVESFTMSRGIDYTDTGRKVEKELIEIANKNPKFFGIAA